MSQDHYVAQTYLRRFVGSDGCLRGYRKADGHSFPCKPRDVCREKDGDTNPRYLSVPNALGAFRTIYEPHWDASVVRVVGGALSHNDRFAIAGYMANLMICTPAWQRVEAKIRQEHALATAIANHKAAGGNDEEARQFFEAVEMLRRDELKIEFDLDYVKGTATRRLMQAAWLSYNQDWVIVRNSTDAPFITSDNPVGIDFTGRHGDLTYRYLPIDPLVCICVVGGSREVSALPNPLKTDDISKPPVGKVTLVEAPVELVQRINALVVKCAEELVFTASKSDEVADLVRTYARYRMDADVVAVPGLTPSEIFLKTVLRVVEQS